MPSASSPAPISQSASAAVCSSPYCLTIDPNTSDTDSLSAPDWPRYSSAARWSVTPWVSSWPITSTAIVKRLNTSPSPSPKIICEPSQNALS